MKKFLIFALLCISVMLPAHVFDVELTWDEFSAECNGIFSGTINNQPGFVQGIFAETAFSGKLQSMGEDSSSFSAVQRFRINSEEGYFSFWIRDKFADDDLNQDMTRISSSQPKVKIFRDGSLIDQIDVPEGSGMVCKVFNLDAELGEIDKELRYFPRSRMIIGSVIDCVSAKPVNKATVTLSSNFDTFGTVTTNEEGLFIIPCEIGEYELSCSKENYIGTTIPVVMGIDESPREVVIAISDKIRDFRIVLTWGSRPRDLDAHLSGPNPDGGDFHIWWQEHYPMGGRDFLDRDDRRSYGPETITIYKPAAGTYQYSVFDYSHRNSGRSKGLQRSGARVDIYGEERLLRSFQVPPGRGNCWHVFRIDPGNNIVEVNKITSCDDDKKIHDKLIQEEL